MKFETVGVVGAGIMGCGVAQNLAQTGHRVILVDVLQTVLDRAIEKIEKELRFQRMFNSSAYPVNTVECIERVVKTTSYERLKNADYLIENVTEKWKIKMNVYRQLDAICPEQCVFASNTSVIPITKIASITKRPDRVLGIHFMNPVPLKNTVEVIKGYQTSDETLEKTYGLLKEMGKDYVIVNDSPGFVSNRVLMLTINEAIFLVQEQVAQPQQIDKIFKKCFGHKMGPLETADLIGLDTILYSIEALYDCFKDSKYRPCSLLQKMVYAGLHGCKNGRGFYEYD